ncbi:chitobiase/beta-hexosaminidase C-terminal domain-containing protein [Candidatus Formimonas warabiya]|uniref:SLH domain-containing protein n=1 Tax=Formimonas warabiya TaxID=1761012 RepID=A0A3G1KUP2_FORW1|nr:chitobiase/beta-hexosaminidase C-terminal domain-containing protein [Candidatus Formimonas warabiya]ATW26162.1 hypothetical protein DCMF_16525 [Candidatus Formimonas warabiya]
METKRGFNPKLFVSLLVVAILLMGMPGYAQAFDSDTSGNDSTITLDPGENTFTYDVEFNDIEQPFASAEFTITVSDGNYVNVKDITFDRDIRKKASGTALSEPRANGNEIMYSTGFLSTENQFSGKLTVCTIEFSYTGTSPQTVTLNNLKLERFTGNTFDGIPELEETEESWSKTITVTVSSDTPTVAAPTANPLPGVYSSHQSVRLSSATADAEIYYTVDGSEPSDSSTLYYSPITVNSSMTIKAFAVKAGYQDSAVKTFSYTISSDTPTVAAPTASPSPGVYSSHQSVRLSSATADAEIYYTVDGSEPSDSSTLYYSPITVNSSMTIKAFAVKAGYQDSAVKTFSYTISSGGSGGSGGSAPTTNPEQQDGGVTFKDVGVQYSWAQEAISNFVARGVIKGYDDGSFKPGNNVTRADFVVMITRLVDLNVEGNVHFNDIPADQYYTQAIGQASEAGIILGQDNGRFVPLGNITRQDAFLIIYRLLNRLGITDETKASLSSFSDASKVAPYAEQAVSFLVGKGMIQGSNGFLNPTQHITRAETAVILYRIADLFSL